MDYLLLKDGFNLLVDFGTPMDDIVATLPYVIPLIFFSITLLLYQRHLPQENIRRKLKQKLFPKHVPRLLKGEKDGR